MNTLDQRRAQYAWERANRNTVVDGYREMVKGAPALVMGNGLMATLAYYRSRTGSNERAASVLLEDVLGWLAKRQIVPAEFASVMNAFFNAGAQDVMRATDETLAMLRWLRQFADAVKDAR
ncbi:MAG: type III-B CRISPR module-associated protein Cmr5 [Candidatus Accumulibacter sp.]|uniref:CRISPR type III-B/RAMP module-associated protein Cmr5 n=1 Tax=Candidatus Accumulibacter affinis TaxID=2954384 RepID=A0A935TAU9_9PROT|nr:type III-B CRISPR module-associated protein Cmr5 [Candidatus Accumulibacter affinis]